MATLSKQQVADIISKAPKGSNPNDIVHGLVSRGYTLEGYNDTKSIISSPATVPGAMNSSSPFASKVGQAVSGVAKSSFDTIKGVGNLAYDVANKISDVSGQTAIMKAAGMKQPAQSPFNAAQSAIETKKNIPQGTLLKANTPIEKVAKTATDIATLFVPLGEGGSAAEMATESVVKPMAEAGLSKAVSKAAVDADAIVNRIIRGTTNVAIKDAKDALLKIEPSAIKGGQSIQKLATALSTKAKAGVDAVTKILEKDPNLYKGNDLNVVNQVGIKKISTNYVNTAIEHLQEFYTKTMDAVGLEKINQLAAKVENGLSQVEINNLAKEYGSKLTNDFFKNTGDLLKSANAKASEAVRTGLKDTSRQIYEMWNPGDKALKALDTATSQLISTQNAVKNVAKEAQKASSKIASSGVFDKIKAAGVGLLDISTGGIIKGIIKKSMTGIADEGLSVLKLEKELPKMLSDLTKLNVGDTLNIKLLKKIIGK